MAKRRVTKDPEVIKFFNEIRQIWKEARIEYTRLKKMGTLDFTVILNIEHNMRKNYLGMLWYSTRPFGNTEFLRVYNWREGTIGPLNELLNYAGAELRSVATKYYSFPKVQYYQVREYPNKKIEILRKNLARKYPPKKGVKVSWTAAYPGNSKCPPVRVRHSTLPEMDFVDMIRTHVVELVRQCFIHNVPKTVAMRYIRLLIYRLQPFLDWVYTDGAMGRGKFWPDADKVLREIVLEIRSRYSRRLGRIPRLTQQIESGSRRPTLADIVTQINRAYIQDTSKEMKKTSTDLLRLMGYSVDKKRETLILRTDTSPTLKKALTRLARDMKYKMREIEEFKEPIRPALTDNDAQDLLDAILNMSQREGNDWHRILFGDMFHPSSLKQLIYAGDRFLDEPSEYLLAAEVPVKSTSGSGQADIVVSVRRSVAGETIFTPIIALDVKTKTGINWTIRGKRPRTKKEHSRIPGLVVRKRALTSTEWSRIVNSTPSSLELKQLQSYESGLVEEYAELVKQDPDHPETLWKGIVLLDSDEDRETMFTLLPQLVKLVINELKTSLAPNERTLYTLNSQGVRKRWQYKFGLVLLPAQGPLHLLRQAIPLESIIEDDPFRGRVKDDVHFTLYLTVPSGGSSGESAAWISRNWHLLHYLSELGESSERKNIKWLDLTGELTENSLRLQRLRLVGDQKPKKLTRRRLEALQQLAEEIKFHDLSNILMEYFFSDANIGIKMLETQIRECIQQTAEEKSIIVIDGWSQLRTIIPSHLNSLLKTLEHRILESLPERDAEIIWLDRPVPVPILSATYQMHRVTPLPHDSPRRLLLDEVIWNLPTSPRNFGWRTPRREDIRVIAQDTPTSIESKVQSFGVPHLKGWARKFRADSKKERTVSVEEVFSDSETYGRAFYTASYVEIGLDSRKIILDDIYQLVPSLSRAHDTENESSDEPPQDVHESEHEMKTMALEKTTSSRGIWDRVSLIQEHQGPSLGRPGTYSSIEDITRGKVRKPTREIPTIQRTSRRPPVVRPTPVEELDTDQTRHDEVLRIQKTAEFLLPKCDPHDGSLQGVLKSTIKICKKYQRGESAVIDTFDQLQKLYARLEVSHDIWKDISNERRFGSGREQIPRSILYFVREKPELLTRYGTPLFLLLLGVTREVNSEFLKNHTPSLWGAVAGWQWVHMGLNPQNDQQGIAQHRFDIPALWSNLLWRARQLESGPVRSRFFESHRIGELIPLDKNDLWLVFQEEPRSEKMIAGLLTGANMTSSLRGTYKTIVDFGLLGEDAERILKKTSSERRKIIITRFDGMDILWVKNLEEMDGSQWSLFGNLSYRAPKEGLTAPIRGVSISGVPKKVIERIPLPDGVAIPSDLGVRVNETLRQIVRDADLAQSVCIKVTINEESGSYLIHLVGRNEEILEELEYETTEEVIGLLRSPITKSNYYQTESGQRYSWDPLKDISYEEVDTKSGWMSLTFLRPRVEQVQFLNGTYVLPRTAREVIESELGEKITMLATPDLDRYKRGLKRCWNVWFVRDELGEGLRLMERVVCTIYDIALLFECEQILDVEKKKRHPTWTSINHLAEVEIPEELIHHSRMGQHMNLKDLANKDGLIY
ncbi:MAG: hypothetical protein RTU63_02315 [Candidatus Thorarchaeota archaeon]